MQSFDEVFFTMMSFCAKKLEKTKLLGEEKKLKSLKLPQQFLNYVLQRYLTSDQKKICIYFKKLNINPKLREENEKKKIKKNDAPLNISKHLTKFLITGLI